MEMKQTMERQVEILKDAIETAGYEVQSYSGRAMFGSTCLGVSVKASEKFSFVADLVDCAKDADDEFETLNAVTKAIRNIRTDALGLGSIIYFPSFEYSEEDEDEEYEAPPNAATAAPSTTRESRSGSFAQ